MTKTFASYELTKKCKRERDFPYKEKKKSVTNVREESNFITRSIRDILFGRKNISSVKTDADVLFEELNYSSEQQRNIKKTDALNIIEGFVNYEKRTAIPTESKEMSYVTKNGEIVTYFCYPSYAVKYTTPAVTFLEGKSGIARVSELEIIQLKARRGRSGNEKPTKALDNLELHFLRKYARKFLVKPGENARIKASLYFLRAGSVGDEEPYRVNFFDRKESSVSIVEDYYKPITEKIGEEHHEDIDDIFVELLTQFYDGIEPEECTEEDCKNCSLKPLCDFHLPPVQVKEDKEERTLSAMRFTKNQKIAKEFDSGVCRIMAGAGTGKTFTMAHNVVSLLNKEQDPEGILAFTYTRAAAEEFATRTALYCEDDGIAEDVDMKKLMIRMTIHGFCYNILKEEYENLGFTEVPVPMETAVRRRILASLIDKMIVPGLNYAAFDTVTPFMKGAVVMASKIIEVWKSHPEYTISDADKVYEELGMDRRFCTKESVEVMYRVCYEYDNILRSENYLEYSDMENILFELLEKDPYYFERKFKIKHIIVDEVQDVSKKQMQIIKHLMNTSHWKSLMAIGDISQSIYGFRGASPELMMDFDKILGTKVSDIQLMENFRCTPEIIGFANYINSLNKFRCEHDLIPTRPSGKKVVVKGFFTKDEELNFVKSKINSWLESGVTPESICILTRTKTEANAVIDFLAKDEIPCVAQFPEPLYEDSYVQAACALMCALRNPELDVETLIYANALSNGKLITADEEEIQTALEEAGIRIRAYRSVEDRDEQLEALTELLTEIDPPDEEYPNGRDSLYRNFKERILSFPIEKAFTYVDDFLKYGQDEMMRREGTYPGIAVSTAHSSKGLEWPYVINMITKYDKESLHTGSASAERNREEERRLLFVSSTRARDELVVTGQYIAFGNAKNGYTPNQFLLESFEAIGSSINAEEVLQMKRDMQRAKAAERRRKNIKKQLDEEAS